MVIPAEVVSGLGYTNTTSHSSVTCHYCGPEYFLPFRSGVPHFMWPRNRYIMWPERIFLIEFFYLFWLKLRFPLKCFWVILFIYNQSVALDQIMVWQIVVPCISLFTSENPFLFFCFFVSGYFVNGLESLHTEWFILCCLLSLTQVSVIWVLLHVRQRCKILKAS